MKERRGKKMAIHLPFCLLLCFFSHTISQFTFTFAKSDTYIVHMDLSDMPKAFSSHHNWYLNSLASISDRVESGKYDDTSSSKLVYAYSNAINGFSAVLSSSELESIKNFPGYISSTKDMPVELDTTHSYQFLGLNSNDGAWPASEYGKDVIIGLVDTGVWPESKSFKDDGMGNIPSKWKVKCESGMHFNFSMCNKKLIGARYFNRGLLASDPNLTISMNSARDTNGHGTHTSSVAAGSHVEGASFFGYAPGTAAGMAPKAHVAMYKAFWDEGAYLSDVVAAIDQAISDGVDVLSLSLGIDELPLYEDPIAISTFAAMAKGIFVSTSSGNRGPGHKTLNNAFPWVLNVAAGAIDREFRRTLILGNGVSATGLSFYTGKSPSIEVPIVFFNKCTDEKALRKIGKKIVVCMDPSSWVTIQAFYLRKAKVAGAVFISNSTDPESLIPTEYPALFLQLDEGPKILDYIKNNTEPKARFAFQETHLGTKPAPKLATYSSRGPSKICPFVLKPDIMAPGDLILASWTPNSSVSLETSGVLFSNFNVVSGTSISCPHAAGVAALLKGAHPEWSPAAIRSAMMTTSYVLDNTKNPIKGSGFENRLATPLGMGAGHVNPNKALDPGLIYDATSEDYINLLCAMSFTSNQIRKITKSVSFNCSNPLLDLNYPSFITYFDANNTNIDGKTVQEFHRTVTNVGDANSVYNAKLETSQGLKVSVSPDRLEFNKKYEKKSYSLSVEAPGLKQYWMVYGSLTWVESGGKREVRSPIVAIEWFP